MRHLQQSKSSYHDKVTEAVVAGRYFEKAFLRHKAGSGASHQPDVNKRHQWLAEQVDILALPKEPKFDRSRAVAAK